MRYNVDESLLKRLYAPQHNSIFEALGFDKIDLLVIEVAEARGLTVRQDLERHLYRLYEIWQLPCMGQSEAKEIDSIWQHLPNLIATANKLQNLKAL